MKLHTSARTRRFANALRQGVGSLSYEHSDEVSGSGASA
jgi:hypothetical protein